MSGSLSLSAKISSRYRCSESSGCISDPATFQFDQYENSIDYIDAMRIQNNEFSYRHGIYNTFLSNSLLQGFFPASAIGNRGIMNYRAHNSGNLIEHFFPAPHRYILPRGTKFSPFFMNTVYEVMANNVPFPIDHDASNDAPVSIKNVFSCHYPARRRTINHILICTKNHLAIAFAKYGSLITVKYRKSAGEFIEIRTNSAWFLFNVIFEASVSNKLIRLWSRPI